MSLRLKTQEVQALRADLEAIFGEARTADGAFDFGRVQRIPNAEGDAVKVAAEVKSRTERLEALGLEVDTLRLAEQKAAEFAAQHAGGDDGAPSTKGHPSGRALHLYEMPQWKTLQRRSDRAEFPEVSFKALFDATSWAPESLRTGQAVEKPVRPPQLIDLLPTFPTGFAAVKYMEETTRTNAAAERAAGAAYAESAFALTERVVPIQSVGHLVPIVEEELQDVPESGSYLEARLVEGVRRRLDSQALVGTGVAPQITGILTAAGLGTVAQGIAPDRAIDAIHRAITLVRNTVFGEPTHVLLTATDWEKLRLARDSTGNLLLGGAGGTAPLTIWGFPVVINQALPVATGLVATLTPASIALRERRGVTVEIGTMNDDFGKGKLTIRAGMRAALTVLRPAAFATVTALA